MSPLTLDGETLGQKHRHLNKLVQDAIAHDNGPKLTEINYDESDIENLTKIDIACKKRNVEYILKVLKCEDMLYVSRALNRCSWLITEPQYAHVINPQFLHTQLFPYMTTKATNKLLLHVRLNLKEVKRVEEFYHYVKQHKPNEAFKWLQNCSLNFIENVFQNESCIPLRIYKRLCRKSFNFIKYYSKVDHGESTVLREISFLLYNHTEEFCNILDAINDDSVPIIFKKHTEVIMKKCPHRILDNFEKYYRRIDISTFAKNLKATEIKNFLLNHVKNEDFKYFLTRFANLEQFVMYMPEEDRHEFIKYVIIERNRATACKNELVALYSDFNVADDFIHLCRWYKYMPFNVAFTDIKKLIRNDSSPSIRSELLTILVNASHNNPDHLHTVLQHYRDNHINEPFKFKMQFINNILTQNVVRFDDRTWNILEQLFRSMEVYAESNKNVRTCIHAIILYNVINDHEIPKIIEKKFIFDTFKKFQSQLNQKQKNKVYIYLFNYLSAKLNNNNIDTELRFRETVGILENAFNLLQDWNKDITDHPILLIKLKQLISLKKEMLWESKLSSLYDINKKWRRHMFAESLSLRASEEVCLNALKHDPLLLARHDAEVAALRVDEAVSLRRLYAKLRVYGPHTIAHQWVDEYYKRLNKTSGHKAAAIGLFSLLPRKRAIEIVKQYVPQKTKINWGESDYDERQFSIRKNIAMYMHLTRPLPPLDTVLWYAKGDYLQYAVPSLSAVLHNLSKTHSEAHILKLVDATVSLQKYGITLLVNKFETEDLVPIFSNIWNNTRNSTIRAMLITYTHKMLCNVTDSVLVKDIWATLSTFIDNLSYDENKIIYQKLGQVKHIHPSVQGDFFAKSYNLLHSLPPKNNCQSIIDNLIKFAPIIMDLLDPEFVVNDLLASIDERYNTTKCSIFSDVIASFLLNGNTEEEQIRRFNRILIPIMDRVFRSWNTVINEEYLVKDNFNDLAESLAWNFKTLLVSRKYQIPVKLFAAIKNKIEKDFPTREKYLLSTYWKLVEAYAKLVEEHKWMLENEEVIQISDGDYQHRWIADKIENILYEMHKKISILLGPMFVKYLQEDVEMYFPSIYSLFGRALQKFFENMFSMDIVTMEILKNMLHSEYFIPSYILVCEELPKYCSNEAKAVRIEIRDKLLSNPSEEVQMHYVKAFRDIPAMNKDDEDKERNNS